MAAVACGIDWAEGHHDVAIVDDAGVVIAAERIGNDAAGLSRLLDLLGGHDPAGGQLPVAIETSQGLLVAGVRAAGRQVFAINPLAVSRYRDRYRPSGREVGFLRCDGPGERPAHRPSGAPAAAR